MNSTTRTVQSRCYAEIEELIGPEASAGLDFEALATDCVALRLKRAHAEIDRRRAIGSRTVSHPAWHNRPSSSRNNRFAVAVGDVVSSRIATVDETVVVASASGP